MNESPLTMGNTKNALEFKHFPTSFQAVVWRNWGMVPVERLAKALKTTAEDIVRIGADMGLVHDDSRCGLWLSRGYQTIIRQNWHLLSYEQLLVLLDWTAERLAFILKEDDFFWHKLGCLKPTVKEPVARPLTAEEAAATAEVKAHHETLLARLPQASERPFDFLESIHATGPADNAAPGLRMLYSYSALYGDPLMDESLNPFPDNMLDAYAASGINALWLQAVLYTLVPWMGDDPVTAELSQGWETRIANLQRLCRRMAARGIKLILYINEPRALPERFYVHHPDWKGVQDAQDPRMFAICTSAPEVLERLKKGVSRLFEQVPELGGFFCITMSENLTNCWSRHWGTEPLGCPRCANRPKSDVIVEVLQALADGAHGVKPDADIIAWSWAWKAPWNEEVVARLPTGVKLMCVSETELPTHVGGHDGMVSDYSMSKPGPGPVAVELWSKAQALGIPCVAKTQFNNTWECSAVPYLPVPGLVEEHIQNLRQAGIRDFMVSWTLGGYPGGNIRLLTKSKEQLAEEDFGMASGMIIKAFDVFDESFRQFPLDSTATLYTGPQNYGPQALLFEEPTGYRASMIGFPYDDLERWRASYPEDVFTNAFDSLSDGWGRGCAMLREARDFVDDDHRAAYEELCRIAEAAFCHFQSSANQIHFVQSRNAGDKAAMRRIVQDEAMIAKRLLALMREDSRIGFEASNHYYYTQNSLEEKLLNCRRLMALLK